MVFTAFAIKDTSQYLQSPEPACPTQASFEEASIPCPFCWAHLAFREFFPWILCLLSLGPSSNLWLKILKWLLRNAEAGNLQVSKRLHWSIGVAYGDLICFVPQPTRGVAFCDLFNYFTALWDAKRNLETSKASRLGKNRMFFLFPIFLTKEFVVHLKN